MMNNTHVRELLGQLVTDVAGAICAPVVHDNDLKNWSEFRHCPICVLDDSSDILLLIKGRKNDGQRFHNVLKLSIRARSPTPIAREKRLNRMTDRNSCGQPYANKYRI